jgi:hypothetical protein
LLRLVKDTAKPNTCHHTPCFWLALIMVYPCGLLLAVSLPTICNPKSSITFQLDLVPYWFLMDRLASSSRSIALLVNYSRSQPVPHNNTCLILWRQLTRSQQLHNLHFVQSCSSTAMM